MKIQSGRIQSVGLNPNQGLSLGFVGMGQATQAEFDALSNPSGTGTGSDPTTSTTTYVDTTALNAQQNLINGMTPAQFAAYQTGAPIPPAQPFQWGSLLMGLAAFGFVVILAKKK